MSKNLKIGRYDERYNKILGVDYAEKNIVQSSGLLAHLYKRKHYKALKYIDQVATIIESPDYIGSNENNRSIEYVKLLKDNILVCVKVDNDGDYYYISTIHDISDKRLARDIRTGRLKTCVDNSQ